MMNSRKRSIVWEVFDVKPDDRSKAECRLCGHLISRGQGPSKNYSCSGLMKHARSKHPEEFQKIEERRSALEKLKLEEFFKMHPPNSCGGMAQFGTGAQSPVEDELLTGNDKEENDAMTRNEKIGRIKCELDTMDDSRDSSFSGIGSQDLRMPVSEANQVEAIEVGEGEYKIVEQAMRPQNCTLRSAILDEESQSSSASEVNSRDLLSKKPLRGRTSLAWQLFDTKYDDVSKAICRICAKLVSRGSTMKNFSPTPLIKHARSKHPEEYSAAAKKRALADNAQTNEDVPTVLTESHPVSSSVTSLTVGESSTSRPLEGSATSVTPVTSSIKRHGYFARKSNLRKSNKSSEPVDMKIGEMLALDMKQYSMVENVGFRRLMSVLKPLYVVPSAEYFREVVIPDMCSRVEKSLRPIVSGVEAKSFTVDVWCSDEMAGTGTTLVCIFGHWLSSDFERHQVLLYCEKVSQRRDVDIASAFRETLSRWKLDPRLCRLVIRKDGDEFEDASEGPGTIPEFGCVLEVLNRSIRDSLSHEGEVSEMIDAARLLASHFSLVSSTSSPKKLSRIQDAPVLNGCNLVPDICGRWTTTLFMLERLREAREGITVLHNNEESCEVPYFKESQWRTLDKIVEILSPFRDIVEELSASEALISVAIPALKLAISNLESSAVEPEVAVFRSRFLESLNGILQRLIGRSAFAVATALDPRFKDKFFPELSCGEIHSKICAMLWTDRIVQDSSKEQTRVSQMSNGLLSNGDIAANDTDSQVMMEKSLGMNEVTSPELQLSTKVRVDKELASYLAEPTVSRETNVLQWWSQNCCRFPRLARMARSHLAAHPVSVPIDVLLGATPDVYGDSTCIDDELPEYVERLLFLKVNLPLVKFQY